MALSPCFYFPLLFPLCSPFCSLLLTWNPPCCDRIRPPWSQVARKLISPSSTPSHSLPIPNSQYPGYLCAPLWRLQDSGFSCPEQERSADREQMDRICRAQVRLDPVQWDPTLLYSAQMVPGTMWPLKDWTEYAKVRHVIIYPETMLPKQLGPHVQTYPKTFTFCL
jgi:hypothetical protein